MKTRKLSLVAACLAALFSSTNLQAQKTSENTKTFSEMLKAEELKRQREEEAIEENVKERDSKFGILPDDVSDDVKQAYQKRLTDFRASVQKLRRAFTRYQITNDGIEEDLRMVEEWDQAFRASHIASQDWIGEMVRLYRSDPEKFKNLGLTLMEITRKEGQLDRVELVLESARAVFELPPADLDPPILDAIGYIGYANGDFDLAQKAWDRYATVGTLPAGKLDMYRNIEATRQRWSEELEQRKLDESRQNPIVELRTSKGVIKVELFEDQAPESVKNFIYLTSNGFYQRMRFFRVVPYFGVQTGCKVGDGTGNAGYSIASEADAPGARPIMRGSLFYALSVKGESAEMDPSTGSSQFMIASAALPSLEDKVTVFGRVIDGSEKTGILRKVDLTKEEEKKDPNVRTDYLIESKVVQKRDHEYKPNPLAGKLPY